YNVLVHALINPMTLAGQFERVVFQVRDALFAGREFQIHCDAVANSGRAINDAPLRLAVTQRFDLLFNFFGGNVDLFAVEMERAVVTEYNGGEDGHLEAEVVGLTYLT